VHELTHLLNRRALGPALPPWLDEGLAEDLAWSQVDPRGRLLPGSFGGSREKKGSVVRWKGAQAALRQLVRESEQGKLTSPSELIDLDWDEFVASPGRELRYAQAAILVRFLLDGRDPGAALGFRRFLRETAQGIPLSRSRLERSVGYSRDLLDREILSWLHARENELTAG
jgi:hypothetical protein